ncbi:MAG: alpha-L-arabinofuranosidase [Bacteroidaceae bacterium]|nr:alpha-L-arabinofuranosidase [Bacteroidaceae bacterium]
MGIFFEDINYAADGGLYAELIQNRDFEYSESDNHREKWNAKTSWTLEGSGTDWSIVTDNPLHANNIHSSLLKTDKVGARLVNGGFDGIAVKKGEKYDLSLFFLSKTVQKVRISLREGDKTLASTVVSLKSGAQWKQYGAVLVPSASAEKAVLAIEPMQTGELQLDFVSLFPQKTFKNRKNGMRADLAQTLADMKPRFVRFPGGCASHGNGIENIYHWKHTVGKPWERKGDFNIWNYHQSRGLGFYEYFQFCEDIGAEPLPVLSAGVPCQNSSRAGRDGKNDGQQGGLSMDEMKDYLQELLDLIEWANGDAKKSKLAAMRAEVGHPKPFNLKYLGIGNEDLISDVFVERYNYLCREIRKAHPEITVVGTVGPFWEGSDYEEGWKIAKQEKLDIVDEHYYNQPGWYFNNQNFYDKYDRNGTKVYLGEWASKGNKLENALVEALHLTNVERNADVVVMSSYAPLLAKEGHTQWNPDLIYFNNTEVKPTVNYYVQALFGQNSGDEYIPGDVEVMFKTDRSNRVSRSDVMKRIGTSVVRDSKTGDVFIKLVNCLPEDVNLTVDLNDIIKVETIKSGKNKTVGASSYYLDADYTVLTGNIAEGNQKPTSGTAKVHSESDDFSLEYTMPKYSFTVIKLKHTDVNKKGTKVK